MRNGKLTTIVFIRDKNSKGQVGSQAATGGGQVWGGQLGVGHGDGKGQVGSRGAVGPRTRPWGSGGTRTARGASGGHVRGRGGGSRLAGCDAGGRGRSD